MNEIYPFRVNDRMMFYLLHKKKDESACIIKHTGHLQGKITGGYSMLTKTNANTLELFYGWQDIMDSIEF